MKQYHTLQPAQRRWSWPPRDGVGAALQDAEDRDERKWAPQVRADRQLALERSQRLAHMVGRTYHYANHDLVVAGDPLPVRLRRSRARNRGSAIGQPTF